MVRWRIGWTIRQKMLAGYTLDSLPVDRAGQGRQVPNFSQWRGDRAVEGARLEIVCAVNPVPRVRIPPSPPFTRKFGSRLGFSRMIGMSIADS